MPQAFGMAVKQGCKVFRLRRFMDGRRNILSLCSAGVYLRR
jgi:hypothetical protein